jgi:hypothetical protein
VRRGLSSFIATDKELLTQPPAPITIGLSAPTDR